MSVVEVADNLYLVPGANKGRFPFSHSILATGERNVLFDTGSGGQALEELKADFPVDLVVNSHTHPDHFSGNGHFEGFELVVPEMFADILADLASMSVRLAGGGEAAEEWLLLVTRFLEHVPTAPTGTYQDGDVIDTGAHSFEAMHTPGHTADHFCFLDRERGILLSFDFDLTPFGPWYGHEESDLDQLHESFRKIRGAAPRMIVSSHREPVSSGIDEKLSAYEDVIRQRGEKVLARLGSVQATPEKIADSSPIYGFVGDQQSALFHYFESRMIEKHLERLVREGAVERNEEGFFRRAP